MSAHAAVIAVAGWEKSLVEAWPSDADDVDGAWVVGVIDEDGSKCPVITVEADQYDAPGDSEKIARALIVLWAQAFAARGGQTQQQPFAVPDGYALVPQTMHLDQGVLEALLFHVGGLDGADEEDRFVDGILWVGEVRGDDGERESYGLNIACAECPEEGSTNLVEFAAPIAQTAPQNVPELSDTSRVPDDYRNQASGYRAGWNDCRMTKQTAPLPVQSGWISIEDRLPKRGQVIIVPRLNSTPFCGKYDPLGGQHRCLDRCLGKWWEFSRWMPMPNAGEARDV